MLSIIRARRGASRRAQPTGGGNFGNGQQIRFVSRALSIKGASSFNPKKKMPGERDHEAQYIYSKYKGAGLTVDTLIKILSDFGIKSEEEATLRLDPRKSRLLRQSTREGSRLTMVSKRNNKSAKNVAAGNNKPVKNISAGNNKSAKNVTADAEAKPDPAVLWMRAEFRGADKDADDKLSLDEFVAYYNSRLGKMRPKFDARYKLSESMLGKGAFGVVHRAERTADSTPVAVKLLCKEGQRIDDVLREVGIWQRLDHPHLVRLYDVYEQRKDLMLITELCFGGDLFQRLVEVEHFSEQTAILLARQVTEALAYLHEQGVAHCDLKPPNILVRDALKPGAQGKMVVKLCDFGLAHLTTMRRKARRHSSMVVMGMQPQAPISASTPGSTNASFSSTNGSFVKNSFKLGSFGAAPKKASVQSSFVRVKVSAAMGTPDYFAPEVVALYHAIKIGYAEEGFDAAVDIWALGCILFELLVGEPPWKSEDEGVLFYKISQNQLEFPEQIFGGLRNGGAEAKALIRQLMQTDPKERISCADARRSPWLSAEGKVRARARPRAHATQLTRINWSGTRHTAARGAARDRASE